jgi:hypothetical protein
MPNSTSDQLRGNDAARLRAVSPRQVGNWLLRSRFANPNTAIGLHGRLFSAFTVGGEVK